VPNRIVGQAEIEARVREDVDSPEAVESLKVAETVFKLLGLVDQDADLRELYELLLTSQVLGLYDDEAKEFLVLQSGDEFGALEETTYAHEYVHRLQDAHFDLKRMRETAEGADASTGAGMSERLSAMSALVEGDAVGVQTSYMTRYITPGQLTEMLQEAQEAEEIAAELPFVLNRSLEFPYLEGATFVAAVRARGGQAAVDAAFRSPPVTTEQVLHPDKFLAGEGPLAVDLPPEDAFGVGWAAGKGDSLGELFLQMWLEGLGASNRVAVSGAKGWGGDAFRTYAGPGGAAGMVAVIAWDAQSEAGEFRTAIEGQLPWGGFDLVSGEAPDQDTLWNGPGGYLRVATIGDSSTGITMTVIAAGPEPGLAQGAVDAVVAGLGE
jgi:hypothetical protein